MPVEGPLGELFDYKRVIGRIGIQDQYSKRLIGGYLKVIESGFLYR